MSGYVPKRVANTRTASATTDIKAASFNNHIISTIGRRRTLRHQLQTRAFGSMWQIDYVNAANNCVKESLVQTVNQHDTLFLEKDVSFNVTIFSDGNTRGFVMKSLQEDLVAKYGGDVYTDDKCAFGNINNYVGDIRMPNNLAGGSQPNGARILAIERWYTSGWLDLSGTAGFPNYDGKNDLVLAVEGTYTNGPKLQINNVTYQPEDHVNPNDFGGITKYGQGAGATAFTLIRYGGSPSGGSDNKDPNSAFSGFSPGESKTLQLAFID